MKEVTAYKCDYCSRCFTRKVNAMLHERTCKNSPERRMCITCKNCKIKVDVTQPIESFFGKMCYNSTPTCLINGIPIYKHPYFEECETTDYPRENPIPRTCWNYEYKGYAKFE